MFDSHYIKIDWNFLQKMDLEKDKTTYGIKLII